MITRGFQDCILGVEVKHFSQNKFSRKASRAIWQAISYCHSKFFLEKKEITPTFVLVFSNLSFLYEHQLLKTGSYVDKGDITMLWKGMMVLAGRANVGSFEIRGSVDNYRGWEISFAGGKYFVCSRYNNNVVYYLSDVNVIGEKDDW